MHGTFSEMLPHTKVDCFGPIDFAGSKDIITFWLNEEQAQTQPI